jgi:hypothetical protein
VLIFVREDFSDRLRVKADPGNHPPTDVFPVMKLNVVKSFQTGVYRYNLMTQVFTTSDARHGRAPGAPTKIVFSNQEWCGALFEQLLFDRTTIRHARFSYFDGEADQNQALEQPPGTVSIDALPLLLRGIHGWKWLPQEPMILPSLERTRLLHRPLAIKKGKITKSRKIDKVEVPIGAIEVETFTVTTGDGDRYIYRIEVAEPRRLIEWEGPDGERARLHGAKRMKYWELNQEGDERALADLGLIPAPAMVAP